MKKFVRICPKCGKEIEYKSSSALYNATKINSVCRSCAKRNSLKKVGNLSRLLEDTPETYYWVGFLLADGSFHNNRLKLGLSIVDFAQLKKFGEFINYTGTYGTLSTRKDVTCMDVTLIEKLRKKFDIKDRKTYNPPKTSIFEEMSIDLLAYLFIGFVDGDGHIANLHNRPDFNLKIKTHSSWLPILKIFEKRLFNLEGHSKINNSGYAEMCIGNTTLLKEFKIKYLKNINFSILNRKWDVIDLNYKSKQELANLDHDKIKNYYEKGYSAKDICSILNFKEGKVYKHLRKIKNEIN